MKKEKKTILNGLVWKTSIDFIFVTQLYCIHLKFHDFGQLLIQDGSFFRWKIPITFANISANAIEIGR